MKIKHILASMGLTMMCGIGALVGLSHVKETKVAKADGEDSMISVVIDLANAVGYTDFHKPEVHYYDAATSTIDKYADLHQLTGTYYTANLPYKNGVESIDTIQFLFKQTNDEDKWSNSLSISLTASTIYHFNFLNTWTGNIWDVEKDAWSGVPRIRGDGISDTNFTADVSTKTYKVTGLSLAPGKTYQIFYGKWSFGAFRQSSIDNYLDDYSLNSFEVQTAGTYDIIAYNNYSDGGIFEIKKHTDPNATHIYYVLENSTPTNDYIYSWGGSAQFGAWPGTKVTEVAGVQEVSGNGVIHFQGGDAKLIYKIPVTTGYPDGDDYFKLNNNNDWESEARSINSHAAYWHTGSPNGDAGYAIDFLVEAEAIRNAAADYSVCNISKQDAIYIVSTYQSLGTYMQETYIDCTTVLTHKRDGSEGNELVAYRAVIEELAKIAEIDLSGSNRMSIINNNNILVVVLVSVTLAGLSAGLFFIIRRRRLQK